MTAPTVPHSDRGRAQRSQRGGDVASFSLAALVFLLTVSGSGCGASKDSEKKPDLSKAVESLQLGQAQRALDLLSKEESAEACWLKAIAFERMEQLDNAAAQIKAGLAIEPENVAFQGLAARLRLYSAQMDAADEIIRLHEARPTSAALALFAFYAHAAQAVQLQTLKKPDEARVSGGKAIRALRAAVTLNADIPEFQREMLSLAAKSQLAEEADLLSERLSLLAPDDLDVLTERASILISLQRFDRAAEVVVKIYELRRRPADAATTLAGVLSRASITPEHDQQFQRLVSDHPQDLSLLVQHGVYLARSGRLADAIRGMEAAIRAQKDAAQKRRMIDALVGLALETGDAKASATLLENHRGDIGDPLVLAYFSGRVKLLNKDFAGALEQFSIVVQAEKDAVGTSRQLAREAIFWTQAILNDREASRALAETADAIRARAGLPPLNALEPAIAEIPEDEGGGNGTSKPDAPTSAPINPR